MENKITFECAMAELEAIVKMLELGSLSLDESLSAFESAVGLIKVCNEKLENAKRQVRLLTENEDGTVTDKPFDTAEDET